MEFLKLSQEDGVAIITIVRPPANAMSQQLVKEIDEAFKSIEADSATRVVVIHGDGRFFSAGADIKEFLSVPNIQQHATEAQAVFERIESFSKPVIASIHGAALGGGLELAMSCHMRYVSKTAKLGLPELSLGLIPGFGGTQRLPRYVGSAKAAEMIFTSDPVAGEEAVNLGLANAAFEEEDLLEETLKVAKKIALKGPIALKATIDLLAYSKSTRFYDGIDAEAATFGQVFATEDAKEGITAFVEKRQAVFKGK